MMRKKYFLSDHRDTLYSAGGHWYLLAGTDLADRVLLARVRLSWFDQLSSFVFNWGRSRKLSGDLCRLVCSLTRHMKAMFDSNAAAMTRELYESLEAIPPLMLESHAPACAEVVYVRRAAVPTPSFADTMAQVVWDSRVGEGGTFCSYTDRAVFDALLYLMDMFLLLSEMVAEYPSIKSTYFEDVPGMDWHFVEWTPRVSRSV